MSFSIGICGLPNVGKSTLFSTLTRKIVKISPVPFTTIKPNVAKVQVKDERLEKIAQIIKPEKITPPTIEFWDIAGLVKGAHKGEGLGNQFLAEIEHVDGILMVARAFEKEGVENYLGEINPQKEFEILETEFLMKDLETIEKALKKTKEPKKINVLKKIKEEIERGIKISQIPLLSEEKEILKDLNFLTQKPTVYLINTNGKKRDFEISKDWLILNLKDELDALELSEEEKKEIGFSSQLDLVIKKCYNVLNLVTFFTIAGGKEAKAWTLKKGSKAIDAAQKVHSDFAKKFIRAEVIFWEDLLKFKSWHEAKEKGEIKLVSKDFILQDGQVIEFKHG